MQSYDLNMIQALTSQSSLTDLMTVKDIVDKEIQYYHENQAKQKQTQVAQQLNQDKAEVERRRATPRYAEENQLRGAQAGCDTQELPEKWKERLHVSESGATSSHVPLRYDLIPRSLIEIAALRYTEGAEKHGERGYQRGLTDRNFILNRINHITEHWNKLFHANDQIDDKEHPSDHLGAIIWGLGFLCEVCNHPEGYRILNGILQDGKVRYL